MESKRCPNCGAQNPTSETICVICGTMLRGRVSAKNKSVRHLPTPVAYNAAAGEDDLMTDGIPGGRWVFLSIVVVIVVFLIFGVLRLGESLTPDGAVSETMPDVTNTLDGTSFMLTLTPPSFTPVLTPTPTLTLTPSPTLTPAPCEVTVQEGDTLLGLAAQCGHQDYGIVPVIVSENGLACEGCLQIGQSLTIPLPTATIDPNAAEEVSDTSAGGSAEEILARQEQQALPTLDPNLQFHVVKNNETMYDIISIYGIDVKLLSEINPEVEFPQCDFGETFGGPDCRVFFYEGQQIRVPAPTPTPTIPPTASGSETPTPTATPTINIPNAFAPESGANFDAASMVTLRWTTSGTLGRDQVYAVRVKNLETNVEYIGVTCDLGYDVPNQWQSDDPESYAPFEWYVTIADVSPFGLEGVEYYVRGSGWNLCDFSFDLPIEWVNLDLPDVGILRDARLVDERYDTIPRQFFWQGQ